MIVEPFHTWPSSTNSNPKPKPKPTPTQTKNWEKAYTAADAGSLGASPKTSAPAPEPKTSSPNPTVAPYVPAITDPAVSGLVAGTGVGSMLNESDAQRQRDDFDAAVAPLTGFVAGTGVGSMLNESEAQRARDERFDAAAAPLTAFVAGTGVGNMLNESDAQRQRDDFDAAAAPLIGFVAGTGVGSMLNESEAQRNRDELGQDADQLIEDHTGVANLGRSGKREVFGATGVAYELQALRREDPAQAAILEEEIINRLDGERLEQFQNALNEINDQEQAAYGHLASYGLGDGEGDIIVSEDAVVAATDDILNEANKTGTRNTRRTSSTYHYFDVHEVEFHLDTLAQRDPALALAVKQELDSRLTPDQVGEVNRLLGGGASVNDNLSSAVNHPGQAAIGIAKYVGNIPSDTGEFASWVLTLGQHPVDLPQFEYTNSAQRGGAVLGAFGEIGLAGKGLISIAGRKIVVRASAEAAEAGADAAARRTPVDVAGAQADDLTTPPTTTPGGNPVRQGDDTAHVADDGPTPTTIPDRGHDHIDVQVADSRLNPSTITDGTYTVNPTDMARHKPETAPPGRSTFRSDIDAERVVLDAARYADEHNLWNDATGKAKVPTNDVVGYHGRTGEPVYEINVYRERRSDGTYNIHGTPASPPRN